MESIRSFYRPIQPSIKSGQQDQVQYIECAPAMALQDFIYCYWELKTSQALEAPFSYRVVSDGCIDILLESSAPDDVFITGFSPQYQEFELGRTFRYLGIRFLPTGFPHLFGIPASDFSQQFLRVEDVLPEIQEFLKKRLQNNNKLEVVKSIFDQCFLQVLSDQQKKIRMDHRVLETLQKITQHDGNLELKSLRVGLSERQLRRLFHFYLGDSPKVFARMLRFQHFLRNQTSFEQMEDSKSFLDLGYYDQAHFIREFKIFYGLSPLQAFKKS